jgi:hypothetical protein
MLEKETRMKTGRTWLRLVRKQLTKWDRKDKRSYLAEKGFTEEELDILMEWDRKDATNTEPPLFE